MYAKILVIATRRIGDVLLTTPLLNALKKAYPQAEIDIIVLKGVSGILEGNSDITHTIPISEKPDKKEYTTIIRKIWRKYDLAIATLPGDRPALLAWAGSKNRIGTLHSTVKKHRWKRWLFTKYALLDDQKYHIVLQNKQITDLLGIEASFTVIPPSSTDSPPVIKEALGEDLFNSGQYCVIHPKPMLRYKELTVQTWIDLARYLQRRGWAIVLSGGPAPEDIELCTHISQQVSNVINLAGTLRFADLSLLLQKSRYFIGPDTSVTHLAAACGVPTLAVFGPTSPVRWGPWPVATDNNVVYSPYQKVAELQQFGNVAVYQPPRSCIPCQEEGCDKHRESKSLCLQEIRVDDLIKHLPETLRSLPHAS